MYSKLRFMLEKKSAKKLPSTFSVDNRTNRKRNWFSTIYKPFIITSNYPNVGAHHMGDIE